MLQVTIPASELFNEITNEFIPVGRQVLRLEHSLVSISKWESTWKKPFLTRDDKNLEETLDYVRCMTITQNVDPNVYRVIPSSVVDQIAEYISTPMTATTINVPKGNGRSGPIMTSEVIYWWMAHYNLPIECEKWHFSRLTTLLTICDIRSKPPTKMSQEEILIQNEALNKMRCAELHTRG